MTSYLRKNEAEKLQNGSVYLAQIPDPMFLTLGWDISRTTWRIKVSDGSSFCTFHAFLFELDLFFDGVSL